MILTTVEVEGLFGYLNHELSFDKQGIADENINLLYGENGTGKTTLLRLIYSCLSRNLSEGLRGYIALVPFKRLCLRTSIGVTIEITRDSPASGPYQYSITTPKEELSVPVKPDETWRVSEESSPEFFSRILPMLEDLSFEILYLSEDRQFRSTLSVLRPTTGRIRRVRRELEDTPEPLNRLVRGETDRTWLDLTIIAASVHDDFRRQLIEQGNFGQMNANAIYLDLAKRLASQWNNSVSSPDKDFDWIIRELDVLEAKAAPVFAIRSISEIPFRDFKKVVQDAPDQRKQDLVRILQPFVESTKARIDALTPLTNILTLLVTELNQFFSRKKVAFSAGDGFSIVGANQAQLPLSALSSGEKHLFLLFCSAYLSRQKRCVFLIDEPELSLNVYWQRNLAKTLQRLTENAGVQYVLATHSLEILTEFRHRISELKS